MLALVLVFSPSEWLNRACFHWFAVMGIFFNEFNHYKTKFAWPGASSISRKDTLNKTNKV